MRIGLIHVAQETNDFNPELTTLRDYESFGLHRGADVIDKSGGVGQVGGHLAAIAESGVQVETVPIVRAHAVAGGLLGGGGRRHAGTDPRPEQDGQDQREGREGARGAARGGHGQNRMASGRAVVADHAPCVQARL